MAGVIYGIKYKADGKYCYVGQTRAAPKERWREHKKGRTPISRALQMFGDGEFEMDVLEEVPLDRLNEREAYWIAELGTLCPAGLNYRESGFYHRMTEATRARMSDARKKLWSDPNFREKTLTGMREAWNDEARREKAAESAKAQMADMETRARIASSHKGQKRSSEARARMSESAKARWADPEFKAREIAKRVGRKASPETRRKMSEASAARSISPELRAAYSEAAARRWAKAREAQGAC
jgi:group I intron endonuclease